MGTLSDIGPAKTSSWAISTSETKLALLMLESRRYILRAEELRCPWGVVERPKSMLLAVDLNERAAGVQIDGDVQPQTGLTQLTEARLGECAGASRHLCRCYHIEGIQRSSLLGCRYLVV